MSLAFVIGAVVLTVIGNVVILRYMLTHSRDLTIEE